MTTKPYYLACAIPCELSAGVKTPVTGQDAAQQFLLFANELLEMVAMMQNLAQFAMHHPISIDLCEPPAMMISVDDVLAESHDLDMYLSDVDADEAINTPGLKSGAPS